MADFSPTPDRSVTRSVDLDAGAGEVWNALTDPQLLAQWLAPEAALEPVPGGVVDCRFADGSARLGRVEDVVENECLIFSWQTPGADPSRVELRLDSLDHGTRLTVVETGSGPDAATGRNPSRPATSMHWGARLESLRLCLASLVYA